MKLFRDNGFYDFKKIDCQTGMSLNKENVPK